MFSRRTTPTTHPSRSKDFISMWQSRGSAVANKGAFQRIPTAPNVHVYLAVVSIEAIGNSVPRDDKSKNVSSLLLATTRFVATTIARHILSLT